MIKKISNIDWNIEENDDLVVMTTMTPQTSSTSINGALAGANYFMEELENEDLARVDDYDVIPISNPKRLRTDKSDSLPITVDYKIKITISKELFQELIKNGSVLDK